MVISSYGGTSWSQITNRFLFGAGSSITIYNDSGTGTSTTINAGTTGGNSGVTLTKNTMPSHTHIVYNALNADDQNYVWGNGNFRASGNRETSSTGGDKPHNNMPPFYGVYIWRRVS